MNDVVPPKSRRHLTSTVLIVVGVVIIFAPIVSGMLGNSIADLFGKGPISEALGWAPILIWVVSPVGALIAIIGILLRIFGVAIAKEPRIEADTPSGKIQRPKSKIRVIGFWTMLVPVFLPPIVNAHFPVSYATFLAGFCMWLFGYVKDRNRQKTLIDVA